MQKFHIVISASKMGNEPWRVQIPTLSDNMKWLTEFVGPVVQWTPHPNNEHEITFPIIGEGWSIAITGFCWFLQIDDDSLALQYRLIFDALPFQYG